MRYDILEPTDDRDASLSRLVAELAPLYSESWYKDKAERMGNPPYDMNVGVFVNMWFSKIMKIFIAYDDADKPVGYLLGLAFRPLTHNRQIFQIEDWYMKKGNETGIFDYVYNALKFMGVDQIQVSHAPQQPYPRPPQNWVEGEASYIDQWKRA